MSNNNEKFIEILENSKKIIKLSKKNDILKNDVTILIKHLLEKLYLLLIINFNTSYFLIFDDIFNFAINYKLIALDELKEYQKYIIDIKCKICKEEEEKKNASYN